MNMASQSSGLLRASHWCQISHAFLGSSLLILLLATSLRIYHIADRSLWLDEAVVANTSGGSLRQMLAGTRYANSAPVIHPTILWVAERLDDGPLAVRLPSLAASLLAVVVLLAMSRIVGPTAAGIAALLLAVSASQIRYAQEVREYSLSVLFAAMLLYAFLCYTSHNTGRRTLCFLLFGAPLIQYGLALFAAAMIGSAIVIFCLDRRGQFKFSDITVWSVCLGSGSLLSFFLTLHSQWGTQERYVQATEDPVRFILDQTMDLLGFVLPASPVGIALFCAITLVLVYAVKAFFLRKPTQLVILVAVSLIVFIASALLHVYPYGGVRQCLFLAPAISLLLGVALSDLIGSLGAAVQKAVLCTVVCGILLCGASQIRDVNPYAEVEDIQTVLNVLEESIRSHDRVYVYYAAVSAVSYYFKQRTYHYSYESSHWRDAKWYIDKILGATGLADTGRCWLVFSSVFNQEDRYIVGQLAQSLQVERIVSVPGASLYLIQLQDFPDTKSTAALKRVPR